jgi:hypothetical protein
MSAPRAPKPARPLTVRAIVVGAAVVAVVGGVLLVLLLVLYGGGTPQDQAHLDAVRTAGAIVIGTGGAVALLLAARRQRSAELTLEHEQRVAAAAEHDANERRVTELYGRAAEQLGSDKAPVRLAGLYALERLGELNEEQRETIVNVVCAYLRMPFTSPGERPAPDADATLYHERTQELQVRLTAQRILRRHRLRTAPDDLWNVTVDLDGANLDHAYLPDINLAGATLFRAELTAVDLTGADLAGTDLTATTLTGADLAGADLTGATLDDADLTGTNFTNAVLAGVVLTGSTWSSRTVWPGGQVEAVVTAASTDLGGDMFRVGDLALS